MTPRPPGTVTAQVGARILARRAKLGLSQRALADRIGCASTAVHRVENGQSNITVEQLVAFARALDCSPATLVR